MLTQSADSQYSFLLSPKKICSKLAHDKQENRYREREMHMHSLFIYEQKCSTCGELAFKGSSVVLCAGNCLFQQLILLTEHL